MTIRDRLSKLKRWTAITSFSGTVIFVVGIPKSATQSGFLVAVALLGFAMWLGGTMFLLFDIRCPRCRGRLGYTISFSGHPFSV